MGTPHLSEAAQEPEVALPATGRRSSGADPRLEEVDRIMADLGERDRRSAVAAAAVADGVHGFMAEFETMCRREARPAMEAVIERLKSDGGGGLIEEHVGGETRVSTPRLTVWLSLQGDIQGTPRPDRHPYLQLDADAKERNVRVSEGDMWGGSEGGHSGRIDSWEIADVSYDRVLLELIAIIRRTTQHPSSHLHAV